MPQTSSVTFPDEFKPLVSALTQGALDAFNWPMQSYTGQRVAPFSPLQSQAFGAFSALAQDPRYAGMFDQSRNMLTQNAQQAAPLVGMRQLAAAPVGTREVNARDITSRMSPYTQDVIDASMADLNKQIERARARTSARQAGIAGRGGAGTQLGEQAWTPFTELEEAGMRAAGSLSSNLRNQGYESARNQINTDLARLLQAGTANQGAGLTAAQANQLNSLRAGTANQGAILQQRALGRQGALDLANLGLSERGMRMGDINAMLGLGGMQQSQAQRPLDVAYQDWQQQQPWGWNRVNNLAGVLYGAPKNTITSGVASPWATAAGLGSSALGMLGGTGAFRGANGTPGWMSGVGDWLGSAASGVGSWLGNLFSADGGYIGHADGGDIYRDEEDDFEPIAAFDALDTGDESLLGGSGEDNLTGDYPGTFVSPRMRELAGMVDPELGYEAAALGEDTVPGGAQADNFNWLDLAGTGMPAPSAAPKASLAERMQTSGYTPADLQKLMADLAPRPIGSAGLFTDAYGQPTVDNFLTRLGLGMLANSTAPGGALQALGLAGGPAVEGLAKSRREALAQEALRQKSAAAQLDAVGKLVAEDQKAKNLGLTTEYTTNAAGERVAAQQAGQNERSAAQIAAQEKVAGIQAGSRTEAAAISAAATKAAAQIRAGAEPEAVRSLRESLRVQGIDATDPRYKQAFSDLAEKVTSGVGPSIKQLQRERDKLPKDSKEWREYDDRIKALGTPPIQKAEETHAIDYYYKTVVPESDVATSQISSYDIIDSYADDAGKFAPMKELLGSTLEASGLSPQAKLIREAKNIQILRGELANAVLSKQLEQKGVQTEADAQRITETLGGYKNQPEAVKFLTRVRRAQATRMNQRQEFFDDFQVANKTRDGAIAAWKTFVRDTPLIAKDPRNGQTMFFSEYVSLMREKNPGANLEDIAALWRTSVK